MNAAALTESRATANPLRPRAHTTMVSHADLCFFGFPGPTAKHKSSETRPFHQAGETPTWLIVRPDKRETIDP
jgi:hypothetical protein